MEKHAKITLRGAHAFCVGVPDEVLDCVLAFPAPGAQYSQAYKDGRWDGMKRLYSRGCFPAGLTSTVQEFLQSQGWVVTVVYPKEYSESLDLSRLTKNYLTGITFWGHQFEGLRALLENINGCIRLPTGSGKTLVVAAGARFLWEEFKFRSLVMTSHRDLIVQTVKAFRNVYQEDLRVGQAGDGVKDYDGAHVVVATAQTLVGYAARVKKSKHGMRAIPADEGLANLLRTFQVLWLDECFPAGSLVDGRPIESLQVGDSVTAFDNLSKSVVVGQVKTKWIRRPSALVRIFFADGTVQAATHNHPFLTSEGWCSASRLQNKLVAVCCTHVNENRMRRLRETRYHETPMEWPAPCVRGLQGQTACSTEDCAVCGHENGLPCVRIACGSEERKRCASIPEWATVLQTGVQEDVVRNGSEQKNDRDQSEVRIVADDHKQPDAQGVFTDQDATNLEADWSQAKSAGRERQGIGGTTPNATDTLSRRDCGAPRIIGQTCHRVPDVLQTGPCLAESEVGGGSGRRFPLHAEAESTGSEKGSGIAFVRVDRVEAVEPGSDGTFGGLCPDGYVYNLEIEKYNTYTVNGFIVHNCHHASSDSWIEIATASKAIRRYGLSGTPLKNNDLMDASLVGVTGPLRYSVKADFLVSVGLCAKPRIVMLMSANVSGPDLPSIVKVFTNSKTGKSSRVTLPMPYKEAYVKAYVENDHHNTAIIRAVAWLVDHKRKVLLVTRRKDHFLRLKADLEKHGLEYTAAWGDTGTVDREMAKKDFINSNGSVLLATTIFDEGTDIPGIDSIVLAEGVKVNTNSLQRLGRGMRRKEGENDVWVIDVVPTCHKTLMEHALVRCETYEEEGHDVTVITDWPAKDVEYDSSLLPFEALTAQKSM